jgi:H+/Cl- antiporter ClcA
MSRPLRLFFTLLGVVVIAIPLSIVTTIALLPVWSWLEASSGIESVGHSGPAEWCYAVVFLVLTMSAGLVVFVRDKSKDNRTNAA